MNHIEKLYLPKSASSCAGEGKSGSIDDTFVTTTPYEEISKFASDATRPIRSRQSKSQPDMICLYQIGHFEHLLEKLGFVFYDNQQRRRDAHVVIETKLRPLLAKEESADKAACLEKLHTLVEQRELTGPTKQAAEGVKTQVATKREDNRLELVESRTVGNAILVPDGISIVKAKACDVIADKVIRAANFTPHLNVPNFSLIREQQDDDPGEQAEDQYISTLSKYMEQELEKDTGAKLIVFEMKNENDDANEFKNWKAAYKAAKKVRQVSVGKKSIMLIPSAEVFERSSGDASIKEIDKKAALQVIQNLLNQANQPQIETTIEGNPYVCLDEQ